MTRQTFYYMNEHEERCEIRYDPELADYPSESAFNGLDYATSAIGYITSLLGYLYPDWYRLIQRAYAVWFRKNLGYGIDEPDRAFFSPPFMDKGQKIKTIQYLFSNPNDAAMIEFIKRLLAGDAHEWKPVDCESIT